MITNPNDARSPDHEDNQPATTLLSMPESNPEKPSPTPLPKTQLFILLYIQLAEPITAHIILPFIVQLIEDTGVTNGDITRVGYYTGLVESLFFLTETLTILQWGRLSDKIGRKPVLLIGLFGLTLSMLSFGLSHTFFAVVASRALAGTLNGNTGVVKCMMGEITDETNVAQGFSFLPLMWAIGNVIGPLLGGLLQHPYDRLGGIFHRSQFWKDYPYFLPCLTAALFSFSGLIVGGCFLKETLYQQHLIPKRPKLTEAHPTPTDSPSDVDENTTLLNKKNASPPALFSLFTRKVVISIVNYALLACIDISFYVLQPLFMSIPIVGGGLGLSPTFVGIYISACGMGIGLVSVVCFSPLCKTFGPRRLATFSIATYFGAFASFPVMNYLARHGGSLCWGVRVILFLQLLMISCSSLSFGTIFLYITAAAESRSTLGATVGLAQTTTSFMRCIGPASATSLFALSQEKNLLGGNLVYAIMFIMTVITTSATFLLPDQPWPRIDTNN